MTDLPTILIVDDDPSHLKLYTWIVGRAGFRVRTALVGSTSVALPDDEKFKAVLLDYRLASALRASDVAVMLEAKYPGVPIFLLSDLAWMPEDMQNHAVKLINKGEPQVLLDTLHNMVATNAA